MMHKEDIDPIIDAWLQGTGFFLVESEILPGNRIMIYIDNETGVTIEDCVQLSKFVESHLNRDEQDFELNVSSAGMDRPLVHPRQFTKAIGKQVELRLKNGIKTSGILREVTPTHYQIEKNPSKNKKKTTTDTLLETVPITEVRDIKRSVTFS